MGREGGEGGGLSGGIEGGGLREDAFRGRVLVEGGRTLLRQFFW